MKIRFLRHQWDKKFRTKVTEEFFRDNRVLEHKELVKLKDLFVERLEFQKS